MPFRDREAIPYLNSAAEAVNSVLPNTKVTRDEENYDTLRQVYLILQVGLDELDKWHAFDLKEKEIEIKAQIKAHQLAYDLIAPLFESIQQAMEVVNQKYKER